MIPISMKFKMIQQLFTISSKKKKKRLPNKATSISISVQYPLRQGWSEKILFDNHPFGQSVATGHE